MCDLLHVFNKTAGQSKAPSIVSVYLCWDMIMLTHREPGRILFFNHDVWKSGGDHFR